LRYYISEAAAAVNIQGNGRGGPAILLEQGVAAPKYNGMVGTVMTISRQEGPKYVLDHKISAVTRIHSFLMFYFRALYNGLCAGLQRQMCFAGIRIGLYDSIKSLYQQQLDGNEVPH